MYKNWYKHTNIKKFLICINMLNLQRQLEFRTEIIAAGIELEKAAGI